MLVQLALLYEFSGQHHLTMDVIKKLPSDLESNDPLISSLVYNIMAYHQIAKNQFDQAISSIARAKRIYAHSNRQLWTTTYTYCFEGMIELLHGNLSIAKEIFRVSNECKNGTSKGISSVCFAYCLYESGDIEHSSALINENIQYIAEVGELDTIIMSFRLAARCAFINDKDSDADRLLCKLVDIADRRGSERAKCAAFIERSRLSLLRGDLEAAQRYNELSQKHNLWSQGEFSFFSNELEDSNISSIRIKILTGQTKAAIEIILLLLVEAKKHNRLYKKAHLNNLLCQAYYALGDLNSSISILIANLKFCETHGFVHLLSDDPWYLNNIFEHAKAKTNGIADHYLKTLSNAISKNRQSYKPYYSDQKSSNPLTPRELDIIKLVAQGKSNKEMARLLSITENTIETHLKKSTKSLIPVTEHKQFQRQETLLLLIETETHKNKKD